MKCRKQKFSSITSGFSLKDYFSITCFLESLLKTSDVDIQESKDLIRIFSRGIMAGELGFYFYESIWIYAGELNY